MPGSMAPLKKLRNTTKLPLALNPLKSKDVLAVLAERNQAIVPVGAWVEPAPPDSSAVPASTSAYMIEEELREQLRKKQEALKRFQRQVKRRVNQQIRLRKKQQLQRSYEAVSSKAEKEGSIATHSLDPAYLTLKRTSVFPNHLNAAIGSARLPPSQKLEDGIEDRENQNELFQQQAQAEPDTEESSSIMIDKKGKKNLSWGDQQDLLFEDKDIPFSTVQKVQFKNPLFAVMEEEEVKQLHQDVLPEAQAYLPEAQGDLLQTQGDLTGVCSVELEAQNVELRLSTEDIKLEGQAVEPKAQAVKTRTQSVMLKDQSVELEDGNIVLDVQDFLLQNQAFLPTDQHILPKDQNVLPKCQDQDFLPTDQHVLLKDQNVQSKCQDQDFLPRDQKANLKPPASIMISRSGGEVFPLDVHQDLLHRHQDQAFINSKKVRFKESYCDTTNEKGREDFSLAGYQYLPPKLQDHAFIRDQNKCIRQPSSFEKWETERRVASGVPSVCFTWYSRPSLSQRHRNYGQASHNMTDERWRKELLLEHHEYVLHEIQDPGSTREQSLRSIRQPSAGTAERWQAGLLLAGHQHRPPKRQREAPSSRQVGGEYQSGLNTEFQTPLALQSGVSQEEDKKERQKQYLRYRRLFMDIEREQVKEQQRQKEQRKKIEKIKKKKEQQRYAEEQRILRTNFHEEPYSGEKMSEILAQLQLEEVKGAREKQQKEKEYQRYVEALRAQIQEKMQLYNITLPPLCCCGPDFWDAHPDTCANNCIFYKNHKAYTRALHSVINSCDIPEGNSALRVAIHNFASAHRRTLKNL
ncbi:coiled-coil domain-containing protein 15 isoform X5 [Mesoplodon densirostris]|uniref:coiled-coil domain-containing protein 15 isoform X5 n=1 Tax=Mesoplodon densirostris TaxID=48708 RepID=UPI0028DB5A84|nr:coiled-coil domain-containing protein 15 isoform X5 [Mesoplodon densirostris]